MDEDCEPKEHNYIAFRYEVDTSGDNPQVQLKDIYCTKCNNVMELEYPPEDEEEDESE